MVAYRSSLFDYSVADTIMSFVDKSCIFILNLKNFCEIFAILENDIASPISSFRTLVPIYFDTSDVNPLDLVLGAELKLLRNASTIPIDDGEIKAYIVEVDRDG